MSDYLWWIARRNFWKWYKERYPDPERSGANQERPWPGCVTIGDQSHEIEPMGWVS
jgi:hypothetical protein